jgi:gamma-glutamyl-gamma-aminobutyraldehyde dehydrogenase
MATPKDLQKDIFQIAQQPVTPGQLLIDGRSRPASSGETLASISPINGLELTTLASAQETDVDSAVQAARKTFEAGTWSKLAPQDRKRILLKWAELIEKHSLALAVLGVRDNGTEISMALKAEPGSFAGTLRYYAEASDKIYGEIAPTAPNTLGLIQHEPIGVVGVITPWNFPLMIGGWKIAPALIAGNSVVMKPSENASLTTLEVARLGLEAGLPPGVLNIITGTGQQAGAALAKHPNVDVIAFTGSGGVGRQLLHYAADSNLKKVYLELGGKSANIVFDDVSDLDQCVDTAINAIFRNAGQVCIAGSRLLLQDSVYEPFLEKLVERTQALAVGNPLELNTQVGAISSAEHLAKVTSFVASGIDEGATMLTGGKQRHNDSGGYYFDPTIFSNVQPQHNIAQTEVFGPVLAVMRFKNEEEALSLANSTTFGLSGALWTRDLSRAHRMIAGMKTGLVHVNTYGGSDLTVPLGGVKESGNGYDKSIHAIQKFTNLKSAWINLA